MCPRGLPRSASPWGTDYDLSKRAGEGAHNPLCWLPFAHAWALRRNDDLVNDIPALRGDAAWNRRSKGWLCAYLAAQARPDGRTRPAESGSRGRLTAGDRRGTRIGMSLRILLQCATSLLRALRFPVGRVSGL